MWFFSTNKDSSATRTGFGFSNLVGGSDVVPGYALDKSCDTDFFSYHGPHGVVWTLRHAIARRNSDQPQVSLLTAEIGGGCGVDAYQSVDCTVRWLKRLRHPNILGWLNGSDTQLLSNPDKRPTEFHVIIERVQPLRRYLKTKADSGNFNLMSSWGLHQICRALSFLNEDAKLTHNQVSLDSIFVTQAGEWNLGCLDYLSQLSGEPSASNSQDRNHIDAYGLGRLIWELFNPNLTFSSASKSELVGRDAVKRLPPTLVPEYRRLLVDAGESTNKKRSSVKQFLTRSRQPNAFFDNTYVDTLLFLEEIQLKDAQERTKFLKNLADQITAFPDDVCRHKILPHLVQSLQYGSAGFDALLPVLRLLPLLSPSDFNQHLLPCLVSLFASRERSTRVRLLDSLPQFVEHLPNQVVESKCLPPILTGFSDTHPLVREATVRAMIHLAPKLSQSTLDGSIVRQLVNLQAKDDQGGIRTNATVCLAKLAPNLSPATQSGPLLNAFLRATRDSFVPHRESALAALAASQSLYTPDLLASKLLPCLAFLTIDSEKAIRNSSFRIIRAILDRLEEESEKKGVKSVNDGDQQQAPSTKVPSTSSSSTALLGQWAWSALSSVSSSLSARAAASKSGTDNASFSTPSHQGPSITAATGAGGTSMLLPKDVSTDEQRRCGSLDDEDEANDWNTFDQPLDDDVSPEKDDLGSLRQGVEPSRNWAVAQGQQSTSDQSAWCRSSADQPSDWTSTNNADDFFDLALSETSTGRRSNRQSKSPSVGRQARQSTAPPPTDTSANSGGGGDWDDW